MVVGGGMTLVGIAIANYYIERIGVVNLLALTIIFGTAVAAFLPQSMFVFLTYTVFALAMGARYWVLGQFIKYRTRRLESLLLDETEKHK